MADDTPAVINEQIVPKSWRSVIIVATLILSWALIIMITLYGDPNNSLHQSALSWAFSIQLVILAGLGCQAAITVITASKK